MFCFSFSRIFDHKFHSYKGSTIPPKHLAPYAHFKVNRSQPRLPVNNKNFNQPYRSKDSGPRYHNNSDKNNHARAPQRYQKSREFWCEPCDRDFRSPDLLQEHKSEHQKCGIDGCKFEGHEIIVSKHIQMQHSTGLYDRLKNLETPEDIMKWREDRKKRYPTKANIELRQQMQEERNKRGEKLSNSNARFGRNSDRRRCNNKSTDGIRVPDKSNEGKSERKHKEGKKKRQRPKKKPFLAVEPQKDESEQNDSASNNGLPMFRGTSQMENYKRRKELQPKNALSSLLGVYESDSESSGETCSEGTDESSEEMEAPITKGMLDKDSMEDTCMTEVGQVLSISGHASVTESDLNDTSTNEESIDKRKQNDQPVSPEHSAGEDMVVDELPSEEPITKGEEINNDSIPSSIDCSKVVKGSKTKRKLVDKRLSKRPTVMDLSKKYRNQNTMLEKLLQNEIRHERNVLLQCVRHVVKGNFFGIGTPASG